MQEPKWIELVPPEAGRHAAAFVQYMEGFLNSHPVKDRVMSAVEREFRRTYYGGRDAQKEEV